MGTLTSAAPGSPGSSWSCWTLVMGSACVRGSRACWRDIGGCPAAVLGVGLGYLHGRELAHGMRPGLFIGGAAISIALVLFYCATVVSSLRPIRAQIGVRVVGSWVVAISTLVLGLALR